MRIKLGRKIKTKCCGVRAVAERGRNGAVELICSGCGADADRHWDWRDSPENSEDGGQLFLRRCPRCRQENPGAAVATGKCCWCGWKPSRVGNEDRD